MRLLMTNYPLTKNAYYAIMNRLNACVAQLAEQLTRNEQVVRSNRITSSKETE